MDLKERSIISSLTDIVAIPDTTIDGIGNLSSSGLTVNPGLHSITLLKSMNCNCRMQLKIIQIAEGYIDFELENQLKQVCMLL
ncbi:MAG: hypothetical protein R2779_06165 [Crocinitomicaceae bacterium]